ncbi:MAG: hypothetical protein F6K61_21500 [Sphaerospermopsis sp. SIO1G1]|nr:hypothetical protein [Sphaerospermopsis sp. SIO1G1]
MKVQKLIEKLSQLPPDAEVAFDGVDDSEVEEMIDEYADELNVDESLNVNVRTHWNLLPLKNSND